MKIKIVTFSLILIIWEGICRILFPDQTLIPSSSRLFLAFIETIHEQKIYYDIFLSIVRVMTGFLLATISGIPLGLIVSKYSFLKKSILPVIELLRPIPPIAWIPLAILIWGLGNGATFFIVFIGAFFPIFSNTYFGANSIPITYTHVAASFEIGTWKYFRDVLFMYSLPHIFTGLKIGLGMAWMSVIAAELISTQSGLGYFIQLNRLLLNLDNVIIGMVLIGITGVLFNKSISMIENKFINWTEK